MQIGLIIDLVLVLVLLGSVSYGYKRGFMKAAYQIISLVLTVFIVFAFRAPMTEYLYSTELGGTISSTVAEKVNMAISQTDYTQGINNVVSEMGFPQFIADSIMKSMQTVENTKGDVVKSIGDNITDTIMTFLSSALLFAVVRIAMSVIMTALDRMCRLPVLRFMNKAAGAIVGAVNALAIIYIACGLVMLLAPTEARPMVNESINQTTVTKYFYNNNYLLELLCLDGIGT